MSIGQPPVVSGKAGECRAEVVGCSKPEHPLGDRRHGRDGEGRFQDELGDEGGLLGH